MEYKRRLFDFEEQLSLGCHVGIFIILIYILSAVVSENIYLGVTLIVLFIVVSSIFYLTLLSKIVRVIITSDLIWLFTSKKKIKINLKDITKFECFYDYLGVYPSWNLTLHTMNTSHILIRIDSFDNYKLMLAELEQKTGKKIIGYESKSP
ncbi:MAG: hypothetical protein Q7S22_05570 [Candidatus Micrarchaeota archaeon]|nr:hypothetical protein [Candidatus Micrarchaeota archaeon]